MTSSYYLVSLLDLSVSYSDDRKEGTGMTPKGLQERHYRGYLDDKGTGMTRKEALVSIFAH
ncbi:hypothetical protein Wcon_00036 [Wolbachia endosymbiont of Cylisticus convexus]|nr:hypothetical protein Wcon_00036 [Wolbachia endosymbiont of Cylisticus convexus]